MIEIIKKIKKQSFHLKHEIYTQLAWMLPCLPPHRYVFVLTNLCNMQCKNCFQDKGIAKTNMTGEQWIALSNSIPSFCRVTLTGGEPLIFSNFQDVLKEVAKRHQCNLITNGTLITDELIELFLSFPKFKILAISIDNLLESKINVRELNAKQWNNLEHVLKIFIQRRNRIKSDCALEIKTLILDENAEDLFNIHRYCMETLKADHHSFQFLKGSPLQHSVTPVGLEEVFKASKAPVYQKFDIIVREIAKIKSYNVKNNKSSFLHPLVADICTQKPLTDFFYLNTEQFNPSFFKHCKFPRSSLHINYDGEVFPCLSVSLGNLRENTLKQILRGAQYNNFCKALQKNGLFRACNRCGWLRPLTGI